MARDRQSGRSRRGARSAPNAVTAMRPTKASPPRCAAHRQPPPSASTGLRCVVMERHCADAAAGPARPWRPRSGAADPAARADEFHARPGRRGAPHEIAQLHAADRSRAVRPAVSMRIGRTPCRSTASEFGADLFRHGRAIRAGGQLQVPAPVARFNCVRTPPDYAAAILEGGSLAWPARLKSRARLPEVRRPAARAARLCRYTWLPGLRLSCPDTASATHRHQLDGRRFSARSVLALMPDAVARSTAHAAARARATCRCWRTPDADPRSRTSRLSVECRPRIAEPRVWYARIGEAPAPPRRYHRKSHTWLESSTMRSIMSRTTAAAGTPTARRCAGPRRTPAAGRPSIGADHGHGATIAASTNPLDPQPRARIPLNMPTVGMDLPGDGPGRSADMSAWSGPSTRRPAARSTSRPAVSRAPSAVSDTGIDFQNRMLRSLRSVYRQPSR